MKFEVVVVGYNCQDWAIKCLSSIHSQTFQDYKVTIINDGSTDNTKDIVENYIKDKPKFKLINFIKNYGSGLYSIDYAIENEVKDPDSIIITVDLDDWLEDNQVFEYMNNIYEDKNIWMSYGNMKASDGTWSGILREVKDIYGYRNWEPFRWELSHLRTFYKKLWQKIDKKDFIDPSTNLYYKTAWDVSMMIPMIEMCGNNHVKFVDKILYTYNNQNSLNDFRTNPKLQVDTCNLIRKKKAYKAIKL